MTAILFDLDNTLYPEADFVSSGYRAVANHLATRYGQEPQRLYDRMWEILTTQGRGQVFDRILAELGAAGETAVQHLVLVYRTHAPAIALPPESAELLADLRRRGYRLGVVTDGHGVVQTNKVRALDLARYVDAVVCTDCLPGRVSKPSPVPFRVALDMLAAEFADAVYVGDDFSKDFLGPNTLGMRTIGLRDRCLIGMPVAVAATEQHLPQAQIDHISDILTLLEETRS